jgi:hypothetical protein
MIRRRVATAAIGVILTAVVAGRSAGGQSAPERLIDPSVPVPYFIADGSGRAGYRTADRELATWAFEAWQRHAGPALRFVPAPEAAAVVRLYWADPHEGQYGEMRPLVVGGRRGAAVYVRPDVAALGLDVAKRGAKDDLLRESIVYLTCLHELGHALGLVHTSDFRDIMYFFGFGGDIVEYFNRYRRQLGSRADIAKVSGLSASDLDRLRSLYATR